MKSVLRPILQFLGLAALVSSILLVGFAAFCNFADTRVWQRRLTRAEVSVRHLRAWSRMGRTGWMTFRLPTHDPSPFVTTLKLEAGLTSPEPLRWLGCGGSFSKNERIERWGAPPKSQTLRDLQSFYFYYAPETGAACVEYGWAYN